MDFDIFLEETMIIGVSEFLYGLAAVIGYMLLVGALGYLIGSLIQVSRILVFLLPVLFVGLLLLDQGKTVAYIFGFYVAETQLIVFIAKVAGTAIVLFAAATAITNRKEVGQ